LADDIILIGFTVIYIFDCLALLLFNVETRVSRFYYHTDSV